MITIGGLHGTGKSTYASALAERFRLRHISAGGVFRSLAREKGVDLYRLSLQAREDRSIDEAVDSYIKQQAALGGVVIDGQLAAFMAGGAASIRFFLLASDEARFRRIAQRDNLSVEEARRLTLEREALEAERYRRFYNLNIGDLTIYDLILNTELLPVESNIAVLVKFVEEYLNRRGESV